MAEELAVEKLGVNENLLDLAGLTAADQKRMDDDPTYALEIFTNALEQTKMGYMRAALALKSMDKAGKPPKGISKYVLWALRRLAEGSIEPEIVLELKGREKLLMRVSNYTPEQRRMLWSHTPILVVEPCEGASGFTHRMLQREDMTPFMAKQVFGPMGIRDENEQRNWLVSKITEEKIKKALPLDEWWVDKKNELVHWGKRTLTKSIILQMLGQL